MPQFAVSRSQPLAIAIAVLVAYLAAGLTVQAAVNPALDPDAAREAAAPFVYALPEGAVSLTGFHCAISEHPEAEAFALEPDYSETPPTVGLELFVDASGHAPLSASARAGFEETVGADIKSPLSARLSRMIVGGDAASLVDGSALEEVSLPEASMSVADLLGRCRP